MLKRGFIGSGSLHLTIIAAASFAWPHAFDIPEDESPVLPVELVTVADETNIAPTIEKPPEPEAPAPPPIQAQAAETPPPPAEVAPSEPEKNPPPPPKEEVKVATAPPPPPLPRRKPTPAPQQQFNVDSVLALLDKRAPPKPPAPKEQAPVAERTVRGIGDRNAQTVDIEDALLAAMRKCWNPPAGAVNAEQLIVQVRVFLTQDGDVAQVYVEAGTQVARAIAGAEDVDKQRSAAAVASNGIRPPLTTAQAGLYSVRGAADAATRAVKSCSPYKFLPPERYDVWREIIVTFDPSKLNG